MNLDSLARSARWGLQDKDTLEFDQPRLDASLGGKAV